MKVRTWMDAYLPWWMLGAIDWPKNRLFRRCWAMDCPIPSRRNVLHTPSQLHRCEGTPMAIGLTDDGWLYANGIDPAVTEPVVPVSRAS